MTQESECVKSRYVHYGDARAVRVLIARLNSDNGDIRAAAAEALGSFPHDTGAVTSLISTMCDDQDRPVRKAAVNSLFKFHDESIASAPAMKLLGNISDEFFIHDEYHFIEQLADRHIVQLVPAFNYALRCAPNPLMRAVAATALEKLNDKRALPALISALQDKDGTVRINAENALKSITGKEFDADHAQWLQWWLDQVNMGLGDK